MLSFSVYLCLSLKKMIEDFSFILGSLCFQFFLFFSLHVSQLLLSSSFCCQCTCFQQPTSSLPFLSNDHILISGLGTQSPKFIRIKEGIVTDSPTNSSVLTHRLCNNFLLLFSSFLYLFCVQLDPNWLW